MGFVTEALRWGGGKHDEDLTQEQLVNILKCFWMSTTPAILVSIVARISAAILLIRIFGTKTWFKWFLIVFTVLQTIAGVSAIVTTWTQAQPLESLWNPTITPIVDQNSTLRNILVDIAYCKVFMRGPLNKL